MAISSDNGIPEEHDSAHGPFSKRRDVPGENRSWKVKRKSRRLNRHAFPASLFCFFYAGRPPDVEVEPWDEPDEGEKLRASARPPEPAERKALSRPLPAAYSRRGQGAAAPRRVHVQERVPAPGAAALHDRGPQRRNWRDLAVEFAKEGSEGSRSAPRGKKGKARAEGRERARHAAWRESVRFVAVSQDCAGAFLNAIPMRDDM